MTRRGYDATGLMLAAGVGVACAVAAGLAMAALASPGGFATRLASLDGRLDELQRMSRQYGAPGAGRADAVCNRPASEAADLLRQTMAGDAGALGLTILRADVAPEAATRATLTPLAIRLEATGSYEGALTLLAHLQKLSPEVFADTLDLTSKTTSVTVSFSGHAFCAA